MIVYVVVALVAYYLLAFALRYAIPLVALVVLVGFLAGCAKPAPVVSVAGPDVPDQLLSCKPEPVPPATGTQRAVATYVLDLADAGDDCRQKLGAVRSIVKPETP